ncbi:hypothetical protein CIB93_13565 [Streptomyces sp. WZ.A104]|nr:hypothetical protein CIB93_13565 [Streptomyces sp. WZ.A104]
MKGTTLVPGHDIPGHDRGARTGSGAVLSDIHRAPEAPRYATRKDFMYGEDVTIGEWTISTDDLPRYA